MHKSREAIDQQQKAVSKDKLQWSGYGPIGGYSPKLIAIPVPQIRIYTDRIVSAVQFTDTYTPPGVMIAEDHIVNNVLVPSVRDELMGRDIFLYKLPKPNEWNIEVAQVVGSPFPFDWIRHGDYVVTYPSGYSRAIEKEVFERDYQEIQLKEEKR